MMVFPNIFFSQHYQWIPMIFQSFFFLVGINEHPQLAATSLIARTASSSPTRSAWKFSPAPKSCWMAMRSWDPGILGWEMNHSIYEDLRIFTGKKYDKPWDLGCLFFFPEKKSRQPAGRSTNLGDDCSSNPSYVLAIWVNSESLGAIWILLVGIETYWSNRYRFQGSRWRGPLSSGTQGAWDVGCRVVPERIVRCRLGTKTRPSVIPWFDASLLVAAVVELAPMSIPPF